MSVDILLTVMFQPQLWPYPGGAWLPDWFMDNWSIRVDPCLKSIYNYIYSIIPLYNIITTINLSILNFPLICCATRTHCGHAWMAHHSVELGASKSTCCCPLIPHPTYLLIYSPYYISNYNLCSVFPSQSFLNIVQCDTTNNSWWSIRVDPFYNWTIRVVPYLSVSWKYSLWWTNIGGLFILGGLLSMAISLFGCALSWILLCQQFVMWCGFMWSRIHCVFPAHILIGFITTSPPI